MKALCKLALACSLTVLAGCVGTNFNRITNDQVVYGVDSVQTIRAKLGKPYREGVVTKNDKQFKTISYAYASKTGDAAYKGVLAIRAQAFYFYENKLVGHEFSSTWSVDSSDFDESKIPQIKKGSSTITEVINLLGNPGGEYIYPLVSNNGEKAKVYVYSQTKGSFKIKVYHKALVVSYSSDGIVTNVEYIESGNK